ncbi:MAG TPA: hypothetical protein VFZ41_06800 [Solirubrobacterales bacterium]
MRILVALARFVLGGTETYSATVAEQLERLGHTVTVHAAEANTNGRELAASRGLRMTVGEPPKLDEVDAILVQDAASAYMLAGRRAGLPLVFASHGFAAFEHPPGGLQPSPTLVVLNDRVARHAAALASRPTVVRLRQPIDIERFRPRGASRRRARRVLLASNYLHGARLRILEEVCGDLGLELVQLGAPSTPTVEPEAALADADIVVGYGRSVLEGMAMGRAAYVWDYAGGDGWVTPESYPALEADGFSGAATDAIIDADRLRADFAGYRPELGALGFDLVRTHHSATEHAEALVEVLGGASAPASEDVLETLALLVRAEYRAAVRAEGLEYETRRLLKEREAQRARADAAEAQRARADAAEAQLDTLLRSRSWRLAAPLRRARALLSRR